MVPIVNDLGFYSQFWQQWLTRLSIGFAVFAVIVVVLLVLILLELKYG